MLGINKSCKWIFKVAGKAAEAAKQRPCGTSINQRRSIKLLSTSAHAANDELVDVAASCR